MRTLTDGKARSEDSTPQSGALSSRQKIARIQENKWWPFDRVDPKLLEKIHKQKTKATKEDKELALL